MNDFLLSILLGVVEGLTEFLPVSSTAHLRIVEALLRLDLHDAYWKMYTIVIQLGAILALPVYFWNRILKFLSTFPRGASGDRTIFTHPLGLTIIAFVITAVPSFLLKKQIGQNLENLWVMAWALFIGGIIMWLVDALCRNPRTLRMEEMSLPQAAWIGLAQITSAVFPGTSRSMSTIAAGQLAGLSRSAALEFSFFLSMPTMVVATGYDLLKTLRLGGANDWRNRFICGGVGRCRLVYELGAGAWVSAVRNLSDRFGGSVIRAANARFDLRNGCDRCYPARSAKLRAV